jgi:alanine racemase
MIEGIVTWIEVDLDAVEHNVSAFKRHVGEQVEVFAVVKANAYGHGAVPVGEAALAAGATRLAVHRAIEGVELRRAGITAPILVMGYTPPNGAAMIAAWDLTPSVTTPEFAQALSAQAVAGGKQVPIHVKVDSGMSRYGLVPPEVVPFLQGIGGLPGLSLEGLFTHLATADSADPAGALAQLATFQQVLSAAREAGFSPPIVHAANSAATMRLPQARFNAVRPGVALYGLQPSAEWPPPFEIRPALSLKSLIARVRRLPAGAGIGYGFTYVTKEPITVALVPIGYGDGYHRVLSNQGIVLVGGQRAPVLGRVSMDQIVVDVSHIPGVRMDDEVVLIGRQGVEQIGAEEVARLAGTINYEVTTSLLPRVARIYRRGGEIIEISALGID